MRFPREGLLPLSGAHDQTWEVLFRQKMALQERRNHRCESFCPGGREMVCHCRANTQAGGRTREHLHQVCRIMCGLLKDIPQGPPVFHIANKGGLTANHSAGAQEAMRHGQDLPCTGGNGMFLHAAQSRKEFPEGELRLTSCPHPGDQPIELPRCTRREAEIHVQIEHHGFTGLQRSLQGL
jgi:hypothetical protein